MLAEPSDADVLRVVAAFDTALDQGDYEAAASLCTPDFTFVGSGEGEESYGAAQFPVMMRSVLQAIADEFVSWKLEFPEQYRVTVQGDTALVTRMGVAELITRNGSRQTRYRLTGALRRAEEGWRWWLFHGSEAQPW